ncbi:MAG TPA: hypothetical protein VMH00_08315 [Candidatus Limnocylindrales bacterium]|nr:hypothetical protein [Candidatus Limnocylindrales bacterium]
MDPRTKPVLWRSILVTLRVWWRALRQLFHEAAGAFFAVFAVYGAVAAWRQWRTRPVAWVIAFAILYTITMLFFSFVSFRRARRLRNE